MDNFFEPTAPKSKLQQYYEYQSWGGTMTIEEWEMDGRYDRSADFELKVQDLSGQATHS